jgi:UDP-sulfoquinovose synthase
MLGRVSKTFVNDRFSRASVGVVSLLSPPVQVLILGGDGYLGWPTALRLSSRGHDVSIVDNFSRRFWHVQQSTDSLTPIPSLSERIEAWAALSGRSVKPFIGDVHDGEFLDRVVAEVLPDVVIHYAEQPSAPFSMKSRHHAVLTQQTNVIGTLNLMFAVRDHVPDCHIVKLGTMGEYGTPNIDVEEGFIEIHHKGRSDVLPYPKLPGSIYHLSKVHDSHNLHFACRVWGLRATDLNQGVVYGIDTEETSLDPRLVTRFDYDEVFGTALNRFCVQAVVGHPITVYGEGGQTRGFLNVRDTLQCVEIAVNNPPAMGEFRVFNQFTEQFSVLELAQLVQRCATEVGIQAEVQHYPNPRVEAEEHYYRAVNDKLLALGLEPHYLGDELIHSMLRAIQLHRDRVIIDAVAPKTRWRPGELSQETKPTGPLQSDPLGRGGRVAEGTRLLSE